MREREYRNRVLLYLNDCEEEERKILACQLYFSMNDFSSPSPPHLFWPPLSFLFCANQVTIFILQHQSHTRREKERKKWLGRDLTKISRISLWAGGGRWNGRGPHTWDLLGGPHILGLFSSYPHTLTRGTGGHVLVVQAVVALVGLLVGPALLAAGSSFFAACGSFFLSLDIPSECSGIHGHQCEWCEQTVRTERMEMTECFVEFFGSFSPLWVSVSRWNYVVCPPRPAGPPFHRDP